MFNACKTTHIFCRPTSQLSSSYIQLRTWSHRTVTTSSLSSTIWLVGAYSSGWATVRWNTTLSTVPVRPS